MTICSECDRDLNPNSGDQYVTITGTHRTFSVCWKCAVASSTDGEVLISCPELLDQFDTPLH